MIYPPDFTNPVAKLETAQYAAECIAGLASARRAVVQAGGCAGLWPLALSTYFEHVYTFEPEPNNFRCLVANVASATNISAFEYALGETHACVGMTRPKAQAGLWRVNGDGEIPMVALDDVLGDAVIDALVLDVEGSEVQALRGADRLIVTHRPLLWFEFLSNASAIEAFLASHGYTRPARGAGGDHYSVHLSQERYGTTG